MLPFVNLSGDSAQEFFSDGMTEEITAALAKIPSLQVVARTSAFEFKGQNRNIQDISQKLHAGYVIEGSVRKAGERVRITAQLIRADSGAHLWTENYDRQLTDIFATQEDIAQAIAAALRAPLGLQQGQRLVSNRTNNESSYEDYLRAKTLVRARGLENISNAAALLEQVVARDPNFAPGWALLALSYSVTPLYRPELISGAIDEAKPVVETLLAKAEPAAQRAVQLDANLADGYVALARVQGLRGKLVQAEELYAKALALDPNSPDALHQYSILLAGAGRLKESLALRQQSQVLEPFVPVFNQLTAQVLALNGQFEPAIALYKDLPTAGRAGTGGAALAWTYASLGRYDEAIDYLLKIPPGGYLPGTVEEAVRLLRTAPAPAASAQSLPRLGALSFVYLYVGAPERALEYDEGAVEAGFKQQVTFLWHPGYAALRKTERFKALMRNAGYVEFWRAKGWPEFCHPTTGDDFVCE